MEEDEAASYDPADYYGSMRRKEFLRRQKRRLRKSKFRLEESPADDSSEMIYKYKEFEIFMQEEAA